MALRLFRSRVVYAIVLGTLVIVIGTGGYSLLEGWPFVDALFMTIITMTTVGFGETYPLSEHGRIFTIVLIVISLGIGGYVFSTLTSFVVEGQIRRIILERKMDKHIAKLKDHVILCGLGRIGVYIAEELQRAHTPFVVIEKDEKALEALSRFRDVLYLQREATQDETLLLAGIKQAKGLITTLGEDKDNVFVVLCARSLNPELYIIARLVEDKNADHLRKAGADQIVAPDAIGGIRMASMMLRPAVVEFLDEMFRFTGQTLRIEEKRVNEFPALQNRSLGEVNIRKRTGALILAIRSHQHGYQFNPGAHAVLHEDDILIVVGTEEQVDPRHWAIECASC